MSTIAIAACCALYLISAIDFARKGQMGLAMTFFAYAVANVGLIMAAQGK